MTSESAGTSDDGPNIEASERVETDTSPGGDRRMPGSWQTSRSVPGSWRTQAAPILMSLRLGAPHRLGWPRDDLPAYHRRRAQETPVRQDELEQCAPCGVTPGLRRERALFVAPP